MPVSGATLFRFGGFEVDLQAEEIRKEGIRLHLPSQPFRILVLLLEQPGKVVTREELRRQLWPDGDPADYDRSLNTAVNRLRVTLCDSVETARYIQTLPRKGYRFLAPVERVNPEPRVSKPPDAETGAGRHRRGRLFLAAGGLGFLVLVAVAILGIRGTKAPPLDAGVPALTDYPGAETTPSWSPDGRQIAFAWNGGQGSNLDIYVLYIGSKIPARLTRSVGNEFAPRYSPDGRRIAFYRRAGDSAYIHVVSASARNLEHYAGYSLEVGPEAPFASAASMNAVPDLASLSWSPDAQVLAYVDKTAPEDPYSIFLLSLESRRADRITWPPAGIRGDGAPALSPDGRSLAFVRSRSLTEGDLYIASIAGGQPRRLTTDKARIRGIAWSRDGRSIVFSSERTGEPNLWRIALSGTAPERLSHVAEAAALPAVPAAADGLAFVRWPQTEEMVRAELPAPGEDPGVTIPSRALRREVGNPTVSPDGTRIAFSSRSDGGGGEIWVTDAQGGNAIRLTPTDRYSGSPRWSPDGRSIAYDSRARNNFGVYDVFVVDAAGGKPRALTAGPLQNSRPSWSSDGRWIYFGSDRSGSLQLWKAPASGGPAQQVTRNGGSEAEESPDGSLLYYGRRTVPGLWSVPVNGGEEKLVLPDLQWQNSRNWTVRREGIYFFAREGDRYSDRKFFLKLLRFRDQRVVPIARLNSESVQNGGCSVSPDGRWLLYIQKEESQTDLAFVPGFR